MAESSSPRPLTVGVRDAVNMTGLGRSTVWNLIREGRLATVKIGHRTLIRVKSIEALLDGAEAA